MQDHDICPTDSHDFVCHYPPHTLLDRHVTLQTASFKIPKQANNLACRYLQDHAPLLEGGSFSTVTIHRAVEQAMCVLTPYQFTCADPFGEHACGSGYYFHARAICHRTPACTKFYTPPIMLSTSCGTCEHSTGYHSEGTKRFQRNVKADIV